MIGKEIHSTDLTVYPTANIQLPRYKIQDTRYIFHLKSHTTIRKDNKSYNNIIVVATSLILGICPRLLLNSLVKSFQAPRLL